LSEKSAVSTPENSAEQKIKIEMTTSKMARAAAVIFYGGTAMLAARIHPPEAGSLVPRKS
jgi:hypothetical protein